EKKAAAYAEGMLDRLSVPTVAPGPRKKITGLPAFIRRPLTRILLKAFVGDSGAYFFNEPVRKSIQARLKIALAGITEPVTLVAHSQGTIISFDVLATISSDTKVAQLVTLASPLGVTEMQDLLAIKRPLTIPANIEKWANFADPLDPVALDVGLANEFEPRDTIADDLVVNTQTGAFNPHSALGYLAHPRVRRTVNAALRIDSMARFVVARDVASAMSSGERQPVLIEILEPGYGALGEEAAETHKHETEVEHGKTSVADRIERVTKTLETIVSDKSAARIDPLKRFVAAHLTPAEIREIAATHRELRVYRVWRSASKRKLISRSGRVLQVDAARQTYRAQGTGIRWAVLDTGVRTDHPHFHANETIEAVWDCTHAGPPRRLERDTDVDGHGTHVSGIIAGESPAAAQTGEHRGMAPRARLVVYKVLNNKGEGEDAWIIKALDHIASQNESNASTAIHGINLSLGGPYDATVYGCGFSPICAELRRQWRAGVLVVVASGNEGQLEVETTEGAQEINAPMSIGDPANLEDCIAVGSVNADRPHLYGISSFSSRGPTSDGRCKPDLVAPGERISSCNARYRRVGGRPLELYRDDSGTSMAAPHVSGLLAAFLSVRPEFRGHPDEVKRILLEGCTDLGRDRYHQGRGVPNLMKMLLAV
ncbi:MAG: S8 family serine peptidase, partial [Burkholderiales bacterium]